MESQCNKDRFDLDIIIGKGYGMQQSAVMVDHNGRTPLIVQFFVHRKERAVRVGRDRTTNHRPNFSPTEPARKSTTCCLMSKLVTMSDFESPTGQQKAKSKVLCVQTVRDLRDDSKIRQYWQHLVSLIVLYKKSVTVRITNETDANRIRNKNFVIKIRSCSVHVGLTR